MPLYQIYWARNIFAPRGGAQNFKIKRKQDEKMI